MSTAASRQRKAGCSLTPVKAAQRFEERPILFSGQNARAAFDSAQKRTPRTNPGAENSPGDWRLQRHTFCAEASPGFIHRRENLNIEMHDRDCGMRFKPRSMEKSNIPRSRDVTPTQSDHYLQQ
ncbi:hypothetical protein [Ralstonia solanacearum]|uniref:hypothetical protein n=1 Tax=Ralstonia solanacearum TaxID=305 RepID=UPI0023DBF1E6|nr:hypothetical protein [Ralstonia solanacearum]